MAAHASESGGRRSRRLGLLRLLVSTALLLAVVAGLAVWVVTRSWFIVGRIEPELERRLGGEVSIGSATYEGSGLFVLENVLLRSRKHQGRGAEVLLVGSARIHVDTDLLAKGEVRFLEMELDDMNLRLSEDASGSGEFTFMALEPDLPESSEETPPPYVTIRRAGIEVGIHDGAEYRMVGRRTMAGELVAAPGRDRWMTFTLHEIDDEGRRLGAAGVSVAGQWHPATNEIRSEVEGLELDERTYGMCPSLVRKWWDAMELEGRVAGASLGWDSENALQVVFDIESVDLTLPVEGSGLWALYRAGEIEDPDERPRMILANGTIRLERDGLWLEDLVGEIHREWEDDETVGVPYTVSLAIPELLDVESMDQALDTTPFELHMVLPEFRVSDEGGGPAPSVLLPGTIARFLERFRLSDWTLETEFTVRRRDGSEAIETEGDAQITDARGAFDRFPYPLEDVEADIVFDHKRVVIERLTGRGVNGGHIEMDGIIEPPGRDARIALNLVARDGPLDAELREAIRPWCGELFETLISESSAASLDDAGLLADDFVLGGALELDLRIERDRGTGNPTITTGHIRLLESGLLCSRFPYPVTIHGGELDWRRDEVRIVTDASGTGISISTPGGGTGSINGFLTIERILNEEGGTAQTRLHPDFSIDVVGDRINDAMLASIPMSVAEKSRMTPDQTWPGTARSEAAELLELMDVQGRLDYQGRIFAADGDVDRLQFEFVLDISEGEAAVTERLLRDVGLEGMHWPEEWTFGGVAGRLRVTNDTIEVIDVRGDHPSCRALASGSIGLDTNESQAALGVTLTEVELNRDLFGVLGSDSAAAAADFFDRYDPRGRFDASLEYHRRGDDHQISSLVIEPRQVMLRMNDQSVTLTRHRGEIKVRPDDLLFDGLELAVTCGTRDDGVVTLDGFHHGVGDDDTWHLETTWTDGRFECPIIAEARRLMGPERLDERTIDPTGAFDAELTFDSAPGADDAYELILHPRTVSFRLDGELIYFTLDEGSRVTAVPGVVTIDRFAGTHAGGRCDVHGTIRLEDQLDIDLRFSGEGRLTSPQLLAFYGADARSALAAIELADGEMSRVTDGHLRLIDLAPAGEPAAWRIAVDATIQASAASFDPGMRFTEVDGRFDLHLRKSPEQPLVLDLDVSEASFTAMDHRVTGVTCAVATDDGERMTVRDLQGDLYGGGIWSEADVGIGDHTDYRLQVNLIGCALDPFVGRVPDDVLDGPASAPVNDSPKLYAGLDLGGRRDAHDLRRGRGRVRLLGSVIDVPLIVKMMQIPHLSLPVVGNLEYGETEFFIRGSRLEFEHILFESYVGDAAPLQLIGDGELDLDSYELDTRFRSRGGWLLVRDILGAIGDQIYVIEVSGPLGDPEASLVPLPGLNPRTRSDATLETQN